MIQDLKPVLALDKPNVNAARLKFTLEDLSLSGLDFVAFRHIKSRIVLKGELFNSQGELISQWTSTQQGSSIRRTAFAPQLAKVFQDVTTAALHEIIIRLYH